MINHILSVFICWFTT